MIIQQPGVVLVPAGLEIQLSLGEKHLRCTHQVAGIETVCQK